MNTMIRLISFCALVVCALLMVGCTNESEFVYFTWLNRIPGFNQLDSAAGETLKGESIRHILLALVMTAVVIIIAYRANRRLADTESAIIPGRRFGATNFIEVILDLLYKTLKDATNERVARQALPLVGTVTLYVFFSNILGLIPGMASPTENLNGAMAPAIVVFVFTHYMGVKEHGALKYAKHFLGPVWYIAPLFLAIELVSHVFRVVSLSLRLMGNMIGDHKVISAFLGLSMASYIFPVPIYFMGLIVCSMQTLVFALLSIIYIQLAVTHEEEEEHGDAKEQAAANCPAITASS